MEYTANAVVPFDAHLLQGCFREAARAEIVAASIDQLRLLLAANFHGHLLLLSEQIRNTSRSLRDLADRSQVSLSRVPLVMDSLNVVLPCLSRSLRDITAYYEDTSMTKENRWRSMYNQMTTEAGGLALPQRFALYNRFLWSLKLLLVRSPYFDMNELDASQERILALRERRNIPAPPLQVMAPVREQLTHTPLPEPNTHWAEQIFSLPLPSRTPLKNRDKISELRGHPMSWAQVNVPAEPRILFRRSFDNDRLSVLVVLDPATLSPFYVIRSHGPEGGHYSSLQGAHELRISREGAALSLERWSHSANRSKLWARLYFPTWEELVLFHCTFVALKSRATLTIQMDPREFQLSREKRLFQAQILDDDFQHSLIVYEDQQTRGLRLHAAVWEGELRQCPVWTAFVTHKRRSPSSTWLSQRSKHRIWLEDVRVYVFCQKYRQERMRQNKAGAFELYFATAEGATKFKDLFANDLASDSSDSDEPVAGPSTRQ